MIPITPAVKQILLINVILFLATMLLPALDLRQLLTLYYPGSPLFKPYQVVTHMFMHGSLSHLIFNMLGLYMFGSELEYRLGAKRFLTLYFIAGLGAMALQLFVYYLELNAYSPDEYAQIMQYGPGMLGASGAIFGLLAAFGMLYPNRGIFLMFIPVPIPAKIFVILYAAAELFMGFQGLQPGVAHFAHLGGALLGFLLILYWRRRREI